MNNKDRRKEKRSFLNIFFFCIATVAIILSIVAVSITAPRDISFDYQGVIVGILALLVTVLVGWQIYNAIDLNRKLEGFDEKVEQKIKSSETNFNKLLQQYEYKTRGIKYLMDGVFYFNDDRLMEALESYGNALTNFIEIEESSEDYINDIFINIGTISCQIWCTNLNSFNNKKLREYNNNVDLLFPKKNFKNAMLQFRCNKIKYFLKDRLIYFKTQPTEEFVNEYNKFFMEHYNRQYVHFYIGNKEV